MTVSRRYRFCASHRLHTPALSAEENKTVYGKCNNPSGHGHDYVLEVFVSGPLDRTTGLIVPVPALDRFINTEVLQIFDHRNLNLDIPYFQSLVPTTENLARIITELIEERWTNFPAGKRARLQAIRLEETDRNSFEILAGQSKSTRAPKTHTEELILHV